MHPPPTVSSSPPAHTLVLRGERFLLSDTQLRSDSPNWITGRFLAKDRPPTFYADRKPELFRAVVLEHLSGYDVFPLKPLEGMNEEETAKAVLAEAEYFSLKRLAEKARAALSAGRSPGLPLWPYMDTLPNQFFSFDGRLPLFSNLVSLATPASLFKGNLADGAPPRLMRFRNLQLRRAASFPLSNVRTLKLPRLYRLKPASELHSLPFAHILFLHPLERSAVREYCGDPSQEAAPVHFWNSVSQQASVDVDGKSISLELLLQWAGNPSAQLSNLAQLKPLTAFFHPELVPRARLVVTLAVKGAIGYWSSGCLRILHLEIRSQDQSHGHLLAP
ncbi:hypothetical protein JCM10213_008539 [Rhodosporidiobolus nylandii]